MIEFNHIWKIFNEVVNMKMKKFKKFIATALATTSFASSAPKPVSAFEWKDEYAYSIVGVCAVVSIFWLAWIEYRAEQARQAEYEERRAIASNIEDSQFRDMCLNLVEIIPVGEIGNMFFIDLCTNNLNKFYGGSVEDWVLKQDAQLNLPSDTLAKIRSICNKYLPDYGLLDRLIERKTEKETQEKQERLERQRMYEDSYQRERDRQHQERLLDKEYDHKKDMQGSQFRHEDRTLDKKLNAANRMSGKKGVRTNINLDI